MDLKPACVLCLALLLAGPACSVRRRGSDAYRLVRAGSRTVLLTPAVPENLDSAAPATLRMAATSARDRSGCSVAGDLFSLAPAGRAWLIRLPALRLWQADERGRDLQDQFEAFLSGVEMLGTKCYGRDGSVPLVRFIEEAAPGPPSAALFFRYRHRVGDGFFDLAPGIRLKLQRAHFRPNATQDLASYLGTTTIGYDCVSARGGGIAFRPEPVLRDPATLAIHPEALPEFLLPGRTHRRPFYRIFLMNDFVPQHFQRAAILVGAQTRTHLDEITRALKARPEIACTEKIFEGVDCLSFEGRITASVEVRALVKAVPKNFGVGTTVGDLLRGLPDEERAAARGSLRLERLYRGAYVPVRFPQNDDATLDLPLLGADRISW